MVTTMLVDVLELCRSTVARMPIIRPAIGFCSKAESLKAAPGS